MLIKQRILHALGLYWIVFLASSCLFSAGSLVFVHIVKGPREAVVNTATIGIRNISLPIMEKAEAAGLPEFVWFLLINGTATLVLFSLPFFLPLIDPSRRDRFPRLIRRFILNDPTLVVLSPLPAFRRIEVPELRQLFASLMVAPLVAPILIGAIVGMLSGVIVDPGDPARTGVFFTALILPHGIFELSALFLAPACMFGLYRTVQADVEAGKTEAVWEALYKDLRWKIWLPRLALALTLITMAGVVEAYATEPLAMALASWMGLEFGG